MKQKYMILLINLLSTLIHAQPCPAQPPSARPSIIYVRPSCPQPAKPQPVPIPPPVVTPSVQTTATLYITDVASNQEIFAGDLDSTEVSLKKLHNEAYINENQSGVPVRKKAIYFSPEPNAYSENKVSVRLVLRTKEVDGRQVVHDQEVTFVKGQNHFVSAKTFRFRRADLSPENS